MATTRGMQLAELMAKEYEAAKRDPRCQALARQEARFRSDNLLNPFDRIAALDRLERVRTEQDRALRLSSTSASACPSPAEPPARTVPAAEPTSFVPHKTFQRAGESESDFAIRNRNLTKAEQDRSSLLASIRSAKTPGERAYLARQWTPVCQRVDSFLD